MAIGQNSAERFYLKPIDKVNSGLAKYNRSILIEWRKAFKYNMLIEAMMAKFGDSGLMFFLYLANEKQIFFPPVLKKKFRNVFAS